MGRPGERLALVFFVYTFSAAYFKLSLIGCKNFDERSGDLLCVDFLSNTGVAVFAGVKAIASVSVFIL